MPRIVESDRAFGLELEFAAMTSVDAIAQRLRPVCDPFTVIMRHQQSRGARWELKRDGSCGLELVSPKLRGHQWPTVRTIVETLGTTPGVHITHQCGFHVHHAVPEFRSNRMFARLFRLWRALEPVALACCAPDRHNNYYCRTLASVTTAPAVTGIRHTRRLAREMGRYVTLNLLPFWRLGTVEFRSHQGTLAYDDIWWWTTFTQAIVDLSARRLRDTTLRTVERPILADRVNALADLLSRYFGDEAVTNMLEGLPRKTMTNPFALVPRILTVAVPVSEPWRAAVNQWIDSAGNWHVAHEDSSWLSHRVEGA